VMRYTTPRLRLLYLFTSAASCENFIREYIWEV